MAVLEDLMPPDWWQELNTFIPNGSPITPWAKYPNRDNPQDHCLGDVFFHRLPRVFLRVDLAEKLVKEIDSGRGLRNACVRLSMNLAEHSVFKDYGITGPQDLPGHYRSLQVVKPTIWANCEARQDLGFPDSQGKATMAVLLERDPIFPQPMLTELVRHYTVAGYDTSRARQLVRHKFLRAAPLLGADMVVPENSQQTLHDLSVMPESLATVRTPADTFPATFDVLQKTFSHEDLCTLAAQMGLAYAFMHWELHVDTRGVTFEIIRHIDPAPSAPTNQIATATETASRPRPRPRLKVSGFGDTTWIPRHHYLEPGMIYKQLVKPVILGPAYIPSSCKDLALGCAFNRTYRAASEIILSCKKLNYAPVSSFSRLPSEFLSAVSSMAHVVEMLERHVAPREMTNAVIETWTDRVGNDGAGLDWNLLQKEMAAVYGPPRSWESCLGDL